MRARSRWKERALAHCKLAPISPASAAMPAIAVVTSNAAQSRSTRAAASWRALRQAVCSSAVMLLVPSSRNTAALHARQRNGGIAVGVDISAPHHRAVRAGIVTGVATPLHLGGSMASYEIAISDEKGRRVCTCRLTCAIRPALTGSPSEE